MLQCQTGSKTKNEYEEEEGRHWKLCGPAKPRNRSRKMSRLEIEVLLIRQKEILEFNQCQRGWTGPIDKPGAVPDQVEYVGAPVKEVKDDPPRKDPEVTVIVPEEVAAPVTQNPILPTSVLENLIFLNPVVSPTLSSPVEAPQESIEDALAQFDQALQRVKSQDIARRTPPTETVAQDPIPEHQEASSSYQWMPSTSYQEPSGYPAQQQEQNWPSQQQQTALQPAQAEQQWPLYPTQHQTASGSGPQPYPHQPIALPPLKGLQMSREDLKDQNGFVNLSQRLPPIQLPPIKTSSSVQEAPRVSPPINPSLLPPPKPLPVKSLLRDMLTSNTPLANEISRSNTPSPSNHEMSLLGKLLEKPPPHLSLLKDMPTIEADSEFPQLPPPVQKPPPKPKPAPKTQRAPKPKVQAKIVVRTGKITYRAEPQQETLRRPASQIGAPVLPTASDSMRMPVKAYLQNMAFKKAIPPTDTIQRKRYYIRKPTPETRPHHPHLNPRPHPHRQVIHHTRFPIQHRPYPPAPYPQVVTTIPNRKRPLESTLLDEQLLEDDPFVMQPNAKNPGPSLAELNRMDEDEEMFETLAVDLREPQSVSTSASDEGSQGSLGTYGESIGDYAFGGMDDFNSMSTMFDPSSLY